MTDGVPLSTKKGRKSGAEKKAEKQAPQTEEELAQIFDKRFELFLGQLSQRVEQEEVRVAVAVIVDPQHPASPMVFKTGHIYDQARLLAHVLKAMRKQMDEELST